MRTNQTQRELVRLLFIEHGPQRASELSKVRYDLVRQWASRYGWAKPRSEAMSQNVTKQVADAVVSELEADERETRLSLSRSARRLSKDAETVTLRDSKHVKNVAQTAAIIHKWDAKANTQANVMVNIALLGIDPDSVQVKGEVIDEDTQA